MVHVMTEKNENKIEKKVLYIYFSINRFSCKRDLKISLNCLRIFLNVKNQERKYIKWIKNINEK